MATATMTNEIDDLEATDEELALIRKLRAKAAMQEMDPYRRQLLLRLKKVKP